MQKQIQRETDVLRTLSHENLISFYFLEEDDRFVYLALSLCYGHFGDVIIALNHY